MAVLFAADNFEGEGLKDLIDHIVKWHTDAEPEDICFPSYNNIEFLSFFPNYSNEEKSASKKWVSWLNKILETRIEEIGAAKRQEKKTIRNTALMNRNIALIGNLCG